jgi:hypothetical protein
MHLPLPQPAFPARRLLLKATALLLGTLAGAPAAWAAPVVQKVSGPLDHSTDVTITGSGFGSKPTGAPLVWDNATSNKISDKWSGGWPSELPGFNIGYYKPMRGINPPHSRDARYIAGAHASNRGAYSGYDVMMYKTIGVPKLPYYIYASWYQRADDQWHFGGDNNFKTFNYSDGHDPYADKSWYVCYGPPHPGSNTDAAQWALEIGTPLVSPDRNGHNAWWGSAVNPMAGQWSKVEITVKVSDQSDGYIKIWENGHSVLDYAGVTDTYGGSHRTISVGGYARMQGFTSNWRYYDDVYLDTTLSRIVLADKPVLSQATIVENQIPSAWSDTSITATVNLGKFAQGQPVYLFVVDSTGTPSGSGLALTAGVTAFMPSAPGAVAVH